MRVVAAGKSHLRERLGTADLLVLASLNEFLLVLKILFSLYPKRATLMRRSTVVSFPPKLVFLGRCYISQTLTVFRAVLRERGRGECSIQGDQIG